jgi:hypothetical protein
LLEMGSNWLGSEGPKVLNERFGQRVRF